MRRPRADHARGLEERAHGPGAAGVDGAHAYAGAREQPRGLRAESACGFSTLQAASGCAVVRLVGGWISSFGELRALLQKDGRESGD